MRRTTTPGRLLALCIACAHAGALSGPSVAFAEDAAGYAPEGAALPRPPRQDVLYLRGGGTLRGTVVELTPGVEARIELENGSEVTVPRADTMRIEQGGPPPAAPPQESSVEAPATQPAPPRGGRSQTWYVVGWVGLGAGAVTAGFTLLLSALGTVVPCELGQCPAVPIDTGPAIALIGGGTAVALGGYFLMDANRPPAATTGSLLPPARGFPVLRGTF